MIVVIVVMVIIVVVIVGVIVVVVVVVIVIVVIVVVGITTIHKQRQTQSNNHSQTTTGCDWLNTTVLGKGPATVRAPASTPRRVTDTAIESPSHEAAMRRFGLMQFMAPRGQTTPVVFSNVRIVPM